MYSEYDKLLKTGKPPAQIEFHEYLNIIIKKKSLNKLEVMKKAGINKNYGYQIFNGTRKPCRDKVIRLCIGMGLSLTELNMVLESSKYAKLIPTDRRDAVIILYSQKDYDISGINDMLLSYGESILD